MFLLNRQFQPLIEVPPDQKNIVYYACIVLYLLSIVFSVLVNMSLLVAVLRSKKNYIQVRYAHCRDLVGKRRL